MKRLLIFSLLLLFGGGACRRQTVEPNTGCEYVATIPLFYYTYAYRFDGANRLTYMLHTIDSRNVTEYVYTYQGKQATIEVMYPQNSSAKSRYDLTLNEQGYVVTAQKTTRTTYNGTAEDKIQSIQTFGYDAQDRLTNYRADLYSYPIGKPKQTETYQGQLLYQEGNPVSISYTYQTDYSTAKRSGTITNQYGTQANRLKIPLQLEDNLNYGLKLDEALLPLLGKPPLMLLARSKVARVGTEPALDSIRYEYQLDTKGQLLGATQQPGRTDAYSYQPKILLLDNRCP